jgi:hypothetical protein
VEIPEISHSFGNDVPLFFGDTLPKKQRQASVTHVRRSGCWASNQATQLGVAVNCASGGKFLGPKSWMPRDEGRNLWVSSEFFHLEIVELMVTKVNLWILKFVWVSWDVLGSPAFQLAPAMNNGLSKELRQTVERGRSAIARNTWFHQSLNSKQQHYP